MTKYNLGPSPHIGGIAELISMHHPLTGVQQEGSLKGAMFLGAAPAGQSARRLPSLIWMQRFHAGQNIGRSQIATAMIARVRGTPILT